MIRQRFKIKNFWKVVVYYNVDFDFLDVIYMELKGIGMTDEKIDEILYKLQTGEAKAATCSNSSMHISIILLPPHPSQKDYLNSIAHEAEHVKQAILEEYGVEDAGEAPAYTIGYIIGQMYKTFMKIMCTSCEGSFSY